MQMQQNKKKTILKQTVIYNHDFELMRAWAQTDMELVWVLYKVKFKMIKL